MPSSCRVLAIRVSVVALIGSCGLTAVAAQKVTPEELVKRHIEQTFGSAAPEHTRTAAGACRVRALMGAGEVDGPFELISTSDTSSLSFRFGIPTYEGESIAFDGKQVEVGFAQRRTNTRSVLGLFLSTYSVIVRDGLLGGVLNRRWPLRDVAGREAKLSSDGMKKLDGRELHRIRYRLNRNQGDLTVHLYFEPETFRHVASVYSASRSQESVLQPTEQQRDELFTVTEKFSDFDPSESRAVPRGWLIHYARTGDQGMEWKYECKVESVTARPEATKQMGR